MAIGPWRGWEYIHNQMGEDAGSALIKWQDGQACYNGLCNPYFDAPRGPYIFIPFLTESSSDTVIHELGHQYMFTANLRWFVCSHSMFQVSSPDCAWTEGWADFFPLPVNGDACFDFDIGPCTGLVDNRYYNLETHSRADDPQQFKWGEAVEGRVAGSLYDLYDGADDGFDQGTFGFPPIWNCIRGVSGEYTFRNFWDWWQIKGYNRTQALWALYQNTIDYGAQINRTFLPLIMK